ncbi:sigma-70 family RNA polymerase sigma factor [Streptomyces sp. NRRL B-24484]|uniref:RNA polymerase sigma factor n=1 Tax=Streptomyces sp. NRRL B-24484 TaxID=1463833 RepID=UPI000996FEB6
MSRGAAWRRPGPGRAAGAPPDRPVRLGLPGNRDDAADAVQDTGVVALLGLAELREAGAARAWLHTVLRSVCLMQLRRRREIPVDHVEPPGTVPGPETVLEEHVPREWLWQALTTPSPDEQVTPLLRHCRPRRRLTGRTASRRPPGRRSGPSRPPPVAGR